MRLKRRSSLKMGQIGLPPDLYSFNLNSKSVYMEQNETIETLIHTNKRLPYTWPHPQTMGCGWGKMRLPIQTITRVFANHLQARIWPPTYCFHPLTILLLSSLFFLQVVQVDCHEMDLGEKCTPGDTVHYCSPAKNLTCCNFECQYISPARPGNSSLSN